MPSGPTYNPKFGRITPGGAGPSLLDAITSIPDAFGQFSKNQSEADDALRRRVSADDAPLPALPAAPSLPGMKLWEPEAAPEPALVPDATDAGRFDVSGAPDWAAERLAFLARGSSPEIGMMADALDANRKIDENASARRPDLYGAMRNELALASLRAARTRADQEIQRDDPAYQREQRELDAIGEAETYLNPTVSRARALETDDAVDRQRVVRELAIRLGIDPRVLAQEALDFERRKTLAQINSTGRNPLAALLGGAEQPGSPSAAARSGITADEIRRRVLARGGSDDDVQRIIAEAQARGALR